MLAPDDEHAPPDRPGGQSRSTAWQALAEETGRILDEAERRGIVLRAAGSVAIRLHCEACRGVLEALGRAAPADVDLFAYARQQRDLDRMFRALGYVPDPSVAHSQEYGVQRLIFHGTSGVKVDLFLDVLRMSHAIAFKGRLERSRRTAPAADLLASKLQIHEVTEKDLQDMAALLSAHGFDGHPDEGLDGAYLVRLMSIDWGLFHTAMGNLAMLERMLSGWGALGAEPRSLIAGRVAELRERAEREPKPLRWRARARIGTRVRWYEDVGEAELQGQGRALTEGETVPWTT